MKNNKVLIKNGKKIIEKIYGKDGIQKKLYLLMLDNKEGRKILTEFKKLNRCDKFTIAELKENANLITWFEDYYIRKELFYVCLQTNKNSKTK